MTTVVSAEHTRALDIAKLNLMSRESSAFFTTVLFSLRIIWSTKHRTAATDGLCIWMNPTFFMSLNISERLFLLLHEALHVAFMHGLRVGDRDRKRWNMAADYVINLLLVNAGFTMPSMGLLDRKYAGMNVEQVYDLLTPQEAEDMEIDLIEGDGTSIPEEDLTREIQDILVRARIQSKMNGDKPGTIPGDIEVYLDSLLNPKLPWHRLLSKYLHAFAKNDYSWKRLNRRFFPRYYLPGLCGERLIDLAVAVDISGSVSDADFQTFINEVAGILRMMKPDKITMIQFDTHLQHVDEVKNIRELEALKFHGRGGTAIEPVMQWATEKRPQLLLVFSDGEFTMPTGRAPTDILWVIHNNERFKPPFGQTIHYKI
jgi:predicted metal-dependent peptidase